MNVNVRALLAGAATIVPILAATSGAQAIEGHGVGVQTYATGFQTATSERGRFGPLGIALDHSNRAYVAEPKRNSLFRFTSPGAADGAHLLGGHVLGAGPTGLAIDGKGRLYAARFGAKDIVEVDRTNGKVVRSIAKGLCGPVGVAVDPISGDLFVTESSCNTGLLRVVDVSGPNPRVERFSGGFGHADGIVVGPDGTIYVADEDPPGGPGGGAVFSVSGLGSASPGQVKFIAAVPGADGLAVGRAAGDGPAPFLIVSRNDGQISRVDMTTNPAAVSSIVTGGDRGEDASAGADGCLYASQQTTVIKVTNADGSCNRAGGLGPLAPATPPREPRGSGELPNRGCLDRRRFTFRLHHGPRSTVVAVDVFVNGRRKVRKRGRDIKRVTIKRLPQKTFRVRIVSRHSNGAKLISQRRYKGCKKSRPKTRRQSGRRGGRRGGQRS